MTDIFEEESWEADISAALAGLGDVEPPPGFLNSAVDHRPMFAGRITAGLLLLAGVALGAVTSAGLMSPSEVVPELQVLTAQHHQAATTGVTADQTESSDLDLPEDFALQGAVSSDSEVEQFLYSADGRAVSVFVQPGEVDFSKFPAEGLTGSDGTAWVSDEVLVTDNGEQAVTIIGLPDGTINEVLLALGNRDHVSDRLTSVMGALVAQLGFDDPR